MRQLTRQLQFSALFGIQREGSVSKIDGLRPLLFRCKKSGVKGLNDELLRAIDLALANDWDAAHQLVQEYENDANAAWIHAVLHKIEGDLGNAGYWYRRAGQMKHVDDEPRAELAAIKAELQS